jgi:hypothetical protein
MGTGFDQKNSKSIFDLVWKIFYLKACAEIFSQVLSFIITIIIFWNEPIWLAHHSEKN